MKPVNDMLNFIRKKTSRKDGKAGSHGEPPLIMASPDLGAFENVRCAPYHHQKQRPRSEMFEDYRENGSVAVCRQSRPLHTIYSTSLDETKFASIQSGQKGIYIKNGKKNGDDSSNCDFSSKSDDTNLESRRYSLTPLNEEPAKYYHSPKCVPKLIASTRSSGSSRTRSSHSDFMCLLSERSVAENSKCNGELTPRLYTKNHQIKTLPSHSASVEQSFDSSTTESGLSESRGSRGSVSDEVNLSPVPPPRRKRSQAREIDFDKSSHTSSGPAEAFPDDEVRMEKSEHDCPEAFDTVDPEEFSFNLPTNFSDLGLDILNVTGSVSSVAVEKTELDLVQKIKENDEKTTLGSINAENYITYNKSRDIVTSEQSTAVCRTSYWKNGPVNHQTASPKPRSSDTAKNDRAVSPKPKFSVTSNIDRAALPTLNVSGTLDINRAVSPKPKFIDTLIADNYELPKRDKLKSEAIVRSIFTNRKDRKQSSVVLSSELLENDDSSESVFAGRKEPLSQSRLVKQTNVEEETSESSSLIKIPEFLRALQRDSGNYSPWYLGNSVKETSPPVLRDSEWNVGFCAKGRTPVSGFGAAQPDVLIGTQKEMLNASLTSLPSDSSKSLDGRQKHYREESGVEIRKEREHGEDVIVFHQLHGFLSKTVVRTSEHSTARDLIEQILLLEKLPPTWYLYRLCMKILNPALIDDGFTELDMRECPVKRLLENSPGGSVQFELHKKGPIQIRVSCEAGLEKPKTVMFEVSCEDTCRSVVDVAVRMFGLKTSTKFCLIQVDRSRREFLMKRMKESQIIAQLHTDYFLLCEQEYLAEVPDDQSRSSCESPTKIKTRSQSSCFPGSPTAVEVDALERKIAKLEAKLVENERNWLQKMKKQQNLMDRYKLIAFCTDPDEKVVHLEAELQRLTREMEDEERRVQEQAAHCKASSNSKEDEKRLQDKLKSLENGLSTIVQERKETYDRLLWEMETIQQKTFSKPCRWKTSTPPLYRICQESRGNCLYAFEMERSRLQAVELFPGNKSNSSCLTVGRSNGCLQLATGDRILEINGVPVHHLNEKELLLVFRELPEKLTIVILREETPANNIYVL